MSHKIRFALLLASTTLASQAFAQTIPSIPSPPIRSAVDENGVDLTSGKLIVQSADVSVGPEQGLSFERQWTGAGWRNNFVMSTSLSSNTLTVNIGGVARTFTVSGSTYTPDQADGSSLSATASAYTYTGPDGTVILFDRTLMNSYWTNVYFGVVNSVATKVTKPDGEIVNLSYKYDELTFQLPGAFFYTTIRYLRLRSVNSTRGYQLKPQYGADSLATNPLEWVRIAKVTAINNGVEYCDPAADACSPTQSWPTATYSNATVGSNTQESVTDTLGQTKRYTTDSLARLVGIKPPSSSTDLVTIGYDSNSRVTSISKFGQSWTYAWSLSGNILTGTITNPLSQQRVTTANINTGVILTDKDELNRTTTSTYDSAGRKTELSAPEGNKVQYAYDSRGNVTQLTAVPKTGSGLSNIVTSATYAASCTNIFTCNKPITTTDARGQVTDYTYDSATGLLTSITAPAATGGANRPQTRYSYTGQQAWTRNAGGSLVASGYPIQLLTAVSSCQTASSCAGAADEVKTTIAYQAGSSSVPSNLLPVSVSSGSGDGALTATQAMTYDNVGNLLTVDGPLSGTADTVRYRYDAGRRLVGVTSADPDGGGARLPLALRNTYNADNQVTLAEIGNVTDQSDAAWTSFSTQQQQATTYDIYSRAIKSESKSGGTTYALTQYSYDALGRPECAATRMNTAIYGSLPSSACTPGTTGSFGPDRISKTTYDAAGQVTKTETGLGTTEVTPVSSTYSQNGKQATVADGLGNLTTYEYDGFDRLGKTRYPIAGSGTASSTTDYEGLTYDANGNVTQRRLRDGQTIGYTYDNLNRLTAKDRPNTVYWETDQSYAYNNLGWTTLASDSNGHQLSFGYDALGRGTTLGDNWYTYGNMTFQYDLAGRRTRATWADGFYAQYDRLVTGEVSAIRENGATSGVGVLGTYAYDNLGRLTTLTRGNGVVTSYAFDAVSRLSSLAHDLAGTTNDVTTTFGYNPASQIAASTRSNDSYAWNGHYNVDRPYTVNGLNQLTAAGSTALGYDGRGNLTSSGSTSYGYTSENQLATATGLTGLAYDPLGRLFNTNAELGVNTTFNYDGAMLTGETDQSTGTLLRRYVYGPGTDDPLVWYEGSGTSDRRWPIPDERGSVVAVTDASGAATAINRYDEYGIPASTNVGRFQYTGQAWLPSLGMYSYKARIYSPTLGRFMQTDPIGYGDGINWYNYVGGDPVNKTDPSGTCKLYIDFECGGDSTTTQPGGGVEIEVTGVPEIVVTGVKTVYVFANLTLPRAPTPSISFGAGIPALAATASNANPQGKPQNKQCVQASSTTQKNFEDITGFLSERAGDLATIAAVTGFGQGAVVLGAASEGLAVAKSISQFSRGDSHGGLATLGNSLVGRAVGQLPRVFPVGGAGQRAFNAGVASVLGNGVAKGLDNIVNCK